MKDCMCGLKTRLSAHKITVNGKRGVYHSIVHMDGSAVCETGEWQTTMFKPYPKVEQDKPYRKMILRWDSGILSDTPTAYPDRQG